MTMLVRITLVLFVAFTALSIVFYASDGLLATSVGPINVNLFDVLLFVAVVLLVREATLRHGQGIPPANRTVLAIVLAYCAYQVAVILPVAVAFHDLSPIPVARALEPRLALLLIPFLYLVGLKYMTPRRLVFWINVAALLLVIFAVYKYSTTGVSGESDAGGAFRVRELWGGASLMFGFLILTSLFLRRPGVLSYVLALVGLVGIGFTNHRSAYLALFLTVPPLLISSRRMLTRVVVLLVLGLTAAALLFTMAPMVRDSVVYSLNTMINPSSDQNAKDRVDRSRLGWEYFVANPLGDYTWSQRYYLTDLGSYAFEPHNFVIQLLGQQGVVGFALFMALVATTARIAWRNRRRDRMSAVMLAYLAFYLIFCLFNTSLLNTNNSFLLMVPIAVILSCNAALAASAKAARDAEDAAAGDALPAGDVLPEAAA